MASKKAMCVQLVLPHSDFALKMPTISLGLNEVSVIRKPASATLRAITVQVTNRKMPHSATASQRLTPPRRTMRGCPQTLPAVPIPPDVR
jgi:hypothetical protein